MTIRGKLRKVWWSIRYGHRPLRLLVYRCAPAIEHEGLLRELRLDCVIDVGANVGQFASLVRAVHPHARLFVFEPLAEALTRLRRVFADDQLTKIYPCALSTASGEMTMHVSGRPDSSSLLDIGPLQSREFRGTQEVTQARVTVRRLDELIDASMLGSANLLKIDVQGAELGVLQGAERILSELQWVYCEVSFVELYAGQPHAADVIRYLDAHGFQLHTVAALARGTSGRVLQADMLFRSSST